MRESDTTDSESELDSSIYDRTLTNEEQAELTETDTQPARVTFSTQDYSVDRLVTRLNSKAMVIPEFGRSDDSVDIAGFQRSFVWTKAQMDRFIESLLLGYPIPGLFLVKQAKDNRLLVLDGQQRLTTLQKFYKGIHNARTFALEFVGDDFKGLTYETLEESMQFKLDDSYMQATIVTTDGSSELDESVFQIFERLNSGGTQLTPHEIRVALFAGPLMSSIQSLNSSESWRTLYGASSKRIRDHELIMRILALHASAETYSRPQKKFLNEFAKNHREVDFTKSDAGLLFLEATKLLEEKVGKQAFRREGISQVNTAQAEAVCVAVMHAISAGTVRDDLSKSISELLEDESFIESTGRSTADREAVEARLKSARKAVCDNGA